MVPEWPALLDAYLAEICRHGRTDAENDWNAPGDVGDPAYPHNIISGSAEGYDALALAYLVRGMLDMAGLGFDRDGRLLPVAEEEAADD